MHGPGKLMLRATIGGYFFGHGMQKLGGWFGPVVTALAMGAGAAGAVYVAERGPELYDALANDSDEPLRCARPVARGH